MGSGRADYACKFFILYLGVEEYQAVHAMLFDVYARFLLTCRPTL